MASLDVIRNLTIRAKTEGVDQSKTSLDGLAASQAKVAESSVKMEKATLSVDAALARTVRRYDQEARAQQELARVSKDLNSAREAGRISQQRQNELMSLAIKHHNSAGDAAGKHSHALQELSNASQGLAGNLGAVGGILARMGPEGLAVAAGLAVMTLGFTAAAAAALSLADTAGKLVDLADSIDISVVALQGLQHAGAQVGVSNEQLTSSLEKFSAVFGNLRDNSQGAIKSFEKLGEGMAQQVANARSFEEALQIVFTALVKLDKPAQSAALKELFGKGGIPIGRIAELTSAAGGIEAFTKSLNAMNIITRAQAEEWDNFGDKIKQNLADAKQNLQSTFTPLLPLLEKLSELVLQIAQQVRLIGTPLVEAFGGAALELVKEWSVELTKFAASLEGMTDAEKVDVILKKIASTSFAEMITSLQNVITFINNVIQAMSALVTVIAAAAKSVNDLRTPAGWLNLPADAAAMASAVSNAASVFQKFGTTADATGTKAQKSFEKTEDAAQDFSKEIKDVLSLFPNFEIKPERKNILDPKTLTDTAKAAKATGKALKEEVNPVLKEMGQIAGQLGGALVSAFLNGKSAGEALNSTLKSISSSAASTAINKLVTGDFSGAAVSGAISLGTAVASFLFGDDEDEKAQQEAAKAAAEAAKAAAAALQQAREAFAGLSKEIQDFTNKANGTRIGELTQALAEFSDQSVKLQEAAIAAQNETALEAIRQTAAAGMNRFLGQFLREVDDLISEFGTGGVMADARESVREMMLQFSALQDSIDEFARRTGADTEVLRQKLQTSTFRALVELLGNTSTGLSEVGTEIARLKGIASELDDALVQLGISAEDAAFIVESRLTVSLRNLGTQLFDPIIREINAFVGGDWINQATDLFARVKQLLADATELGLDTTLIQTFYVLAAQDIINANQLVGNSFNALVNMLGLAGNGLHEFTAEVENAAETLVRSAQQIADAVRANEDRLFAALHRSDSLSDQLARFDRQAQADRAAELAAGGEAIASLEAAIAQERLNIINDFFEQQADIAQQATQESINAEQQAADERARILQEAMTFLEGATFRIQEWINHFLASAQSPLSPSQQLASAQQSFAAQYAAAIGGNRDALNAITGNAQDVVDAARRYYGSSAPGQSIIQTMLAQLRGLPNQLSPEQFIVDNLTPPIVGVGSTVTTTTTTQTQQLAALLNNLKLAVESQDAQAIAIALLPLFDRLDTTMDQALSFSEFQAGLGGSIAPGILQSIFNTLDLNGDQMLQKTELIKIAAQGSNATLDPIEDNTAAAKVLLQQQIDRMVTLNAETVLWLTQIWDKLTVLIQQVITSNSYLQTMAAWPAGSNHAAGGWITGGTPGMDSVNARLTPGEFVVKQSVASKNPWLEDFNRTGMYPAANDNGGSFVAAIHGLERSLMRGIAALIETQLETAGIISRPIQEGNKLQRTRRGEKKKAA